MAICKGGYAAIKHIWSNITPALDKVVEITTEATGMIKAIEGNPTIEAIVKALPFGSQVEKWANKAMDTIAAAEGVAITVAEKITNWLNGKTEIEKNGDVFKLASAMAKAGHEETGEPVQTESFYDSAVQLHVIINK